MNQRPEGAMSNQPRATPCGNGQTNNQRPEGAMSNQPRATPCGNEQINNQRPEGAKAFKYYVAITV